MSHDALGLTQPQEMGTIVSLGREGDDEVSWLLYYLLIGESICNIRSLCTGIVVFT